MSGLQDADDVAHDAGVLCPVNESGIHGLRYAEGDWYCPRCYASLRLGVWYPARNDGSKPIVDYSEGRLNWGDGDPCAHWGDPCEKCGKPFPLGQRIDGQGAENNV